MSRLNKTKYIERHGYDAWAEEAARRKSRRNKEKDDAYEQARKGKRNAYFKERRQKIYATQLGRADNLVRRYNNEDKRRELDISNNVDKEWVVKHIFPSKCVYCGDTDWHHLGCDRVDDSLPHVAENIVPCCGVCNVEKGAMRMSHEEFIEYRKTHPRELKRQSPFIIGEVETQSGKKIKVIKKNPLLCA